LGDKRLFKNNWKSKYEYSQDDRNIETDKTIHTKEAFLMEGIVKDSYKEKSALKRILKCFKKKDERIEKINKALGITLTEQQELYILSMGVEIGTFLNASSRQNGRTTAYHIKLALSDTIVYSDGRQTNDLIEYRENHRVNKHTFRDFIEIRKKLRDYGFNVCKVIDINTKREI
jgi:2-hydroxy-3-keto-5-methylthiopentenyl-1-phosphate phosphatase